MRQTFIFVENKNGFRRIRHHAYKLLFKNFNQYLLSMLSCRENHGLMDFETYGIPFIEVDHILHGID